MDIIFYQYTGEKNVLNKVLGNPVTLTGHITNGTSLINPSITIGLNTNITVCNYCYIPAFGRYYFINDIQTSYKELIISLHCDVLMSFKAEILASEGQIVRAAVGDNYLADNLVVQKSVVKRQCQKIGNSFTKNERFVIQIGG